MAKGEGRKRMIKGQGRSNKSACFAPCNFSPFPFTLYRVWEELSSDQDHI